MKRLRAHEGSGRPFKLVDESFADYTEIAGLELSLADANARTDLKRIDNLTRTRPGCFRRGGTSANPGPRICTKCRRVIHDDIAGTLCPDCGATTYPQGYCPVCEDFLRLPVGALCPKHDVELEDGVPSLDSPHRIG